MRPLIAVLLIALPLVAAPVPKVLKKVESEDGLWQVVEFDGDGGKMKDKGTVGLYWRIDGGKMSNGKANPKDLAVEGCPHTLVPVASARPQVREMKLGQGGSRSCVIEVDGDTLRWAWATDEAKTITECRPAPGVYYYVFQRVKEK